MKLALSEQDATKTRQNINYAFDKDQTTETYYVMVKAFLIELLILREYI